MEGMQYWIGQRSENIRTSLERNLRNEVMERNIEYYH